MPNTLKKDFLLLHLCVFIAGFTGLFGRLINLNEAILVWYRVAVSAIALLILLLSTQRLKRYTIKEIFKMGVVGMLLCFHWLFFYASIKASNVSIGVVCFSLVGFFTAIFEPLLGKRRFSATDFMLSTLTLLGVYLVFHFDSQYQLGIVFGVISSALCSLFIIYNQQIGSNYDTRNFVLWEMVGGLIGLSLATPLYLLFIPADALTPSSLDWLYLLFLSLICTVGLYWLQTIVLQRIPAFTVNLTYNLEPVYSILFSIIIFNEAQELNFSFLLGLGCIILSVILQSLRTAKKHQKQKPVTL